MHTVPPASTGKPGPHLGEGSKSPRGRRQRPSAAAYSGWGDGYGGGDNVRRCHCRRCERSSNWEPQRRGCAVRRMCGTSPGGGPAARRPPEAGPTDGRRCRPVPQRRRAQRQRQSPLQTLSVTWVASSLILLDSILNAFRTVCTCPSPYKKWCETPAAPCHSAWISEFEGFPRSGSGSIVATPVRKIVYSFTLPGR